MTSKLNNANLTFTDASSNVGIVNFASNEFGVDKPISFSAGVSATQLAVSGSGQITALSSVGTFDVDTLKLNGSASGQTTLLAAASTTSHTLTLPATQGAAGSLLQNDGSGGLSWFKYPIVAGNVDIGDVGGGSTATVGGDFTSATKVNNDFGSSGSQVTLRWSSKGSSPKSVTLQAGWNDSNSFDTEDNDIDVPLVKSLIDGRLVFQLEESSSVTQNLLFYVTVFY